MTGWSQIDLASLSAGRRWIEHLESLALPVFKVPAGTFLWHGVEHDLQFDLQRKRLTDRQWFSVDRQIARSYAAKPGFLLAYSTRRTTLCVEVGQNDLIHHPATKRLLQELGPVGGIPAPASQWDVDVVAVKRWYLLDAIRMAIGRNDIDGFFDNPRPDREFYFRDISSTVEMCDCTELPAEN